MEAIALDACRVPIYHRDGSVRRYMLVDESDLEFVTRWHWYLSQYGYAYRSFKQNGRLKRVFLHRELLGLQPGDGRQGDHINRVKLDNRRSNLRDLPPGVNQQNRPSYSGSTSQYRGVCWHKGKQKWMASVQQRGKKTVHVGYFHDEHEAGRAAQAARLKVLPYAID